MFHKKYVWVLFPVLLLASCLSPLNGPAPAPTLEPGLVASAIAGTQTALVPPTATATLPPSETPTPTTTSTSTAVTKPAISRVLILSIDGLRPDAIAVAPMPNLLVLMQNGAYSLVAQTIMPSSTLPSHASMLAGLCPQKHGVDWNDDLPGRGYANGVDIFDLAHTAGLRTVMVVGKDKLRHVTEPGSTDEFIYINDRDTVITAKVVELIPQGFGVLFIHFSTNDAMGHEYGWLSPEQLSVLRRADQAIGSLLLAIDQAGMRGDTLIIVTADHGGHEHTHGTNAPEDMTIPWIINGPGVVPGPIGAPIHTTDTAATAAWALGLAAPSDWDGRPVLEAFGLPAAPRIEPRCP